MHNINALLTIDDVASILRVHRSTISRLLKRKELSFIALGGKKLVDSKDLEQFINRKKVTILEKLDNVTY